MSDFRDSGAFLVTLMSSIDVCLDDTWLPLEDWIVCPASSKLGSSLCTLECLLQFCYHCINYSLLLHILIHYNDLLTLFRSCILSTILPSL